MTRILRPWRAMPTLPKLTAKSAFGRLRAFFCSSAKLSIRARAFVCRAFGCRDIHSLSFRSTTCAPADSSEFDVSACLVHALRVGT